MELFETTIEDVMTTRDFFIASAEPDSKGVFVVVIGAAVE